jgi:hypothetical protein
MSYPQDCLIIQVDVHDIEPIETYRILRNTEEKGNKLVSKKPAMYTRVAPSQRELNVVPFFIQALNKGLIWTSKNNPVHVSKEKFAWKVFITTSYKTLSDIPDQEQLIEQFKKFDCTDSKIEEYLYLDQTNFFRYQIVIDLTSMTSEKSKILEKIGQQQVFVSSHRHDFFESLALFQQFETQLFDVLKSL